MTPSWQRLCWMLGLASASTSTLIVGFGHCALAQIQPDNTSNSGIELGIINGTQITQITGGTARGTNLFHSFQQFNVSAGQGAFFTNPVGIENILARVTGSNLSDIQGILGVTGGNANLFLINPNGIIFGPDARLNLGGSFVATTANAIALANGDIFSTNLGVPLPSQVLNVNPNAFFFNQIAAQPIVSQARLQVLPGASLMLVGGDVRQDGGLLQAPGGRIELAGVAGVGNVTLNTNGNTLSLNLPDGVARADVSLTNRAIVNVAATGGGSIAVNARNLDILGGSHLSAGIAFGGTANPQAGDITLNTTNTLTIADGGSVFNAIYVPGNAGNIRIDTRRFLLRDGVVANGSLSNNTRAGNLIVNASESVEITGTTANGRVAINTAFSSSPIPGVPIGLSTAPLGSGGSAGDLTITTGQLTVQGGARLAVGTDNPSPGGNLTLIASDFVKLIGTSANGSPTLAASGTQGSGVSGDVSIETRRLVVQNGAIVTAGTSLDGQGGKITVRASESVELLGTATVPLPDADVQLLIGTSLSPVIGVRPLPSSLISGTAGAGNSGDLTIETGRLVIQGGAQASTSTGGSGKGGALRVRASEIDVSGISPDGFFSSALAIDSRSAGDAGNLSIATQRITLRDGGQVLASTSGTGDAGTLEVNATDSVQVIGTAANGKPSSLFFDTSGSGDAGKLRITTGTLLVQNGGRVSAGTTGTGQGGRLNVNASELVDVSGTSADGQTPSRLLFDTSNAGDAGELTITTPVLRIRDGGQVSARTSGSGRGGVLEVTASESVDVSGTSANGQFASGLYFDTSSAASARGIKIETGSLNVRDGGQVTVSGTGSGAAGDLEIDAGSIALSNNGKLTATTTSGEGGNIRLRVNDSIIMRYNSEISTEASGTGNGGNMTIDTGGIIFAILSENSDVVANAFQGRGGNILAKARGVYGFRRFENRRTLESDFTASSQVGIDGVVDIDVRNEPQAIPLPERVVTAEIEQACQANQGQKQNEFIITGRGGLPDNPSGTLSSDAVWTDWREPGVENRIQSEESVTNQSQTSQPPIVEANGWMINDNGKVVLIATAPTVQPHSSGMPPTTCRDF